MSSFTGFHGEKFLASGTATEVALAAKALLSDYPGADVLIFNDATGRQTDFNLTGSEAEVLERLAPKPQEAAPEKRAPGRPRLGVVAREITLLPRQWEWLSEQPGGASATLRKLVDAARTADMPREQVRRAKTAADRFMMAMLGDKPGYEEAARALYAGDAKTFKSRISNWPKDLRTHLERLAAPAFDTN
ncbi:DUF2239 family protein [Nitratireductor aquimarinus]|uniref:DUF2239 family protein n=1 Tax=Nitratireductor TaxID=245876 RepID=UPI0019D3D4EE|nr:MULTISPECIES: DUF2239 family protein [Nitratireductor]MBN7774959.1 DUF2239 family protein [Nitratireductor pacificus]MBN7779820.1 DUF2239 family protein [Nitratireductor pacificus]MBN7788627.1 DUF2239 family protein [Nitratireductor aquimarinus]MBN8242693.1 DUF2239 family protein [Nitratireductor aquimarinus]MBY6097346.1 DUF2239 family protein [Nitratireductor aquimarinus]